MTQSTMVYILAVFAIGFLFGMILETFIDTKTIREQTAENNELRVLNDKQGKEIVKLRYENEELGKLNVDFDVLLNAMFNIDDTKDADTDESAVEAKARAQDAAKKTAPKPKASAPTAPAPVEAPAIPDARTQLRELIRKYNLDGTKIATDCKLNPKSTAKDYEKALAYAQALAEGSVYDTSGEV